MKQLMVLLVVSFTMVAGDVQTVFRFDGPKDLYESLCKSMVHRCPDFDGEERSEIAVCLATKYGNTYIDESLFLAQSFGSYVPLRLCWIGADRLPFENVKARLEGIRLHGTSIRGALAACGMLMTIVRVKDRRYTLAPPA